MTKKPQKFGIISGFKKLAANNKLAQVAHHMPSKGQKFRLRAGMK